MSRPLPRFTELAAEWATAQPALATLLRDLLEWIRLTPQMEIRKLRVRGGSGFGLLLAGHVLPPKALLLLRAAESDNPAAYPTSAEATLRWTWRRDDPRRDPVAEVAAIANLTSGTDYDVTIMVVS